MFVRDIQIKNSLDVSCALPRPTGIPIATAYYSRLVLYTLVFRRVLHINVLSYRAQCR